MRERVIRDASLVALGFMVFEAINTAWHFFLWPSLVAMDFNCVGIGPYGGSRAAATPGPSARGSVCGGPRRGALSPGGDPAVSAVRRSSRNLWWLIPGGIIAWSINRLRPARWTWPSLPSSLPSRIRGR